MQTRLGRFFGVSIVTGVWLVWGAGTSHAQMTLEKLHVGYSAQAGSLAPIWITKEAGIFAKHGLDVELLFIPDGPTVVAAMLSGEVPLAVVGGPAVVSGEYF